MEKAKITFSNNETLMIKEGDYFIPIVQTETDGDVTSSQGKVYEIWSHTHDGLIPSVTELFYKGKFFCSVDDTNTIYSTSAIVKIENL